MKSGNFYESQRKTSCFLACSLLICFLLLCSCSGDSFSSTSTYAPGQTTTVSPVATGSPSSTQHVTSVPQPLISLNLAILGGSIYAFDKKFGSDNCCFYTGWTPSNGPYVAVWDDSYTDLNFDETSQNRVVRISIEPQSNDPTYTPAWDARAAANICNSYLPPDAIFQSGYAVFQAGATEADIEVYYSSLLAHTLPVQDFIDRRGDPGTPGLIYVYFRYNDDANHIGHCTLGVRGQDDLEY